MTPETERRLREVSQAHAKLAVERDQAIRQAYDEGASLREIAAVVGLTHTGVKRIIDRR